MSHLTWPGHAPGLTLVFVPGRRSPRLKKLACCQTQKHLRFKSAALYQTGVSRAGLLATMGPGAWPACARPCA